MATNTASLEVSGSRKRKLSTKASTNGDPLEAKRKKSAANMNVTAALTKKKAAGAAAPSITATGTSKTIHNGASEKVAGKKARKRHESVDDMDGLDDHTSENFGSTDGNDNNPDTVHEIISIDDDDKKMEEETNLEDAEESAEDELGRKFLFYISH
jgi:hypothetical protein